MVGGKGGGSEEGGREAPPLSSRLSTKGHRRHECGNIVLHILPAGGDGFVFLIYCCLNVE